MALIIRNDNKLLLVKEMAKPPTISGRMIADELGVSSVTVYRWMQEPTDAQTERMMEAIANIRDAKK